MSKWHPIESAPENQLVLIRGGNLGFWTPSVVSAKKEEGIWYLDQWEQHDLLAPTEWMPITGLAEV